MVDSKSPSTIQSKLYTELVDAMAESSDPAILLGIELLDAVGHNAPGTEVSASPNMASRFKKPIYKY